MTARSRGSGGGSTTWICATPPASPCASPSCVTRRRSRSAGGNRDNGRDERMSKARDNKKLMVGLDVGTSKIAAIVAEGTPEGGFEIIGMGSHASRGLKKGVVVNIETTVNAIQRALEEAELMGDCKIREVYTGIAGNHIKSFNSQGLVAH